MILKLRNTSLKLVLALLCWNCSVIYADSQNPAYSLEELPNTYVVSGQEKKLLYTAATSTTLAGSTYTTDSDFDEPQTPTSDFIFYYDLLTKQLSLGPALPDTITIQKMLITAQKKALISASVRSPQSEETQYKLFIAESDSTLAEFPAPLSQFYSQRLMGNADTGIYLTLKYYTPAGQLKVLNYQLSDSLQFQELAYIPSNQEIVQITLAGLILTSELEESNSYTIFDPQTGQVVKRISPSLRIDSLLNHSTAATIDFEKETVSTYNLDNGNRGIRIIDVYSGVLPFSEEAFVVETDQGGITFFNSSNQISPNCVQPKNSKTRISFISSSESTGKALLCRGTSLAAESHLEAKSFLITPNFASEPANYCTRLSVKAVAGCKKYFKGTNNYIYHNRGELPKTCKFSLQLLKDSSSKGTAGRLRYAAYYKKSKATKEATIKIKKKAAIITLDMQSLSSVRFQAIPSDRSSHESTAVITAY